MPSKKFSHSEQLGLCWDTPGLIAGVDEAGRGPLAGPVVAAAVILDDLNPIEGLNDSKKLSATTRERLFDEIRANGYASTGRNKFTATPGKTSSIAVPVFDAQGIAGALVLIFFASAIKMNEAITLYVDELKATANTISQELRQPLPPERAGPRVTRNLSVSL